MPSTKPRKRYIVGAIDLLWKLMSHAAYHGSLKTLLRPMYPTQPPVRIMFRAPKLYSSSWTLGLGKVPVPEKAHRNPTLCHPPSHSRNLFSPLVLATPLATSGKHGLYQYRTFPRSSLLLPAFCGHSGDRCCPYIDPYLRSLFARNVTPIMEATALL